MAGKYHIVVVLPEMLQSCRFVDKVLRKPEFGACVLSVFVVEAHCVSLLGASFHKYATIGIMCAFLPCSTPMIAVTATLTPRVHRDIIQKLEYDPNNYIFNNIGNDRPNVTQVVCAIEHPMNLYHDLDFIVPETMTCPEDINKAFVYVNDIITGGKIGDHLNSRVVPNFRHLGLIWPYNAAMSKSYCKAVMQLFKTGVVRVLICTDAAGMVICVCHVAR